MMNKKVNGQWSFNKKLKEKLIDGIKMKTCDQAKHHLNSQLIVQGPWKAECHLAMRDETWQLSNER